MSKQSLIKGKCAEDLAAALLVKKGYKILAKNWNSKWGELDLIAIKGRMDVLFIEVKYRKNAKFGYPVEFISLNKLQKLETTIRIFLANHTYGGITWRLDGLCFLQTEKGLRVRWYKNLFSDF